MSSPDTPAAPEQGSSKVPSLPERYSSLMPSSVQRSLEAKSRAVSSASEIANLSMKSSVSDFLAQKIRLHRSSLEYLDEYRNGLSEALSSNQLQNKDYHDEMENLDNSNLTILHEVQVLEKQRRTLELDIQQAYEDSDQKRQKSSPEPPIDFMERAYASAVVARVMPACKQKKRRLDQSEFRTDVVEYLNAGSDPEGHGRIWCHLTGWLLKERVKAAHLVPETLRGHELEYLFGVGEVVLSDPRNGITLHSRIEKALNTGAIVIVPVLSSSNFEITRWKCILVDNSIRNLMYDCLGDEIRHWAELDMKDLTFRSANRPARRYLYFRYIITYLHAKKEGNQAWTDKVDNRTIFWATPGPWVEESTLCSLGRNISGFELPPSIYEGNTFTSPTEPKPADENQNRLLCVRVREATMVSLKDREEEEGDTSENDEDF